MTPVAPKHTCPGRGPRYGRCPGLIDRGESCCTDCKPHEKIAARRYEAERDQGEQRQFLHSRRWRAIREVKLNRDPLCERHLLRGIDEPAVLVHHKDRDETNWNDDNLESLCNECHEAEHKSERFGRAKTNMISTR